MSRELLRNGETFFPQLCFVQPLVVASGPAAFGKRLTRLVLARQDSTSQRTVDHDSDAMRLAQRQQLDLDIAVYEVVQRLDGGKAGQAELVARPKSFANAPRTKIRAGGIQNLALMHGVVKKAKRLVD